MIDTFLAKVTYVAPAAYDANGNLRTAAPIKLDVSATKNSTAATNSDGVINRIWWAGNTADGTGLPLLT